MFLAWLRRWVGLVGLGMYRIIFVYFTRDQFLRYPFQQETAAETILRFLLNLSLLIQKWKLVSVAYCCFLLPFLTLRLCFHLISVLVLTKWAMCSSLLIVTEKIIRVFVVAAKEGFGL